MNGHDGTNRGFLNIIWNTPKILCFWQDNSHNSLPPQSSEIQYVIKCYKFQDYLTVSSVNVNWKTDPHLYSSAVSSSLSSSNSSERVFLQLNSTLILYWRNTLLSIKDINSGTINTQIYVGYKTWLLVLRHLSEWFIICYKHTKI